MSGPRTRDLRLDAKTARRRRLIRLRHRDGRLMHWCHQCDKFSVNLATHQCGKRQP